MNARRIALFLVTLAAGGLVAACSGSGAGAPPSVTATSPPATLAPPTTPSATAPTTAPTTAAATPSPAAGDVPRCTAGQLSVSLGQGDAAAGSVYRPLIFTNTGRGTCELRGFPGVSYVAGDDGHQVGPAAEMSGDRGGQVVIRPGGTAIAPLQLVNVQNFDTNVCRPTPVGGLRVYPPGDTAALFVPMDGTGCAGTPPGPQLTVQTMRSP